MRRSSLFWESFVCLLSSQACVSRSIFHMSLIESEIPENLRYFPPLRVVQYKVEYVLYAKVLKILYFESLFYRHLISDLDRSRPTFGQKNWQVWSPKNGKKIRYTFEYFCTFFSFLILTKKKKFSSLNHFFSSSYDCTSISYFNLENL